ncbi:MAG: hypothetical protein JXQ97_17105 [Natronospirillum sp.]
MKATPKKASAKRSFIKINRTAATTVTFAAVVSDVLNPIAPFGLYIFFALAIAAISFALIKPLSKAITPYLNLDTVQNFNEVVFPRLKKWSIGFGASSLVFLGLWFYSDKISNVNGQNIGIIAYNISEVALLQNSLGIIDDRLLSISHGIDNISEGIKSIDSNTEILASQATLEPNRVISAIHSGDMNFLNQARQRGFNFSYVNNNIGGSNSNITKTHLVIAFESNQHNINEVLDFLSDEGVVDVNQSIVAFGGYPPVLNERALSHIMDSNTGTKSLEQFNAVSNRFNQKNQELITLRSEINNCKNFGSGSQIAIQTRALQIQTEDTQRVREENNQLQERLLVQYNSERRDAHRKSIIDWEEKNQRALEQLDSMERATTPEEQIRRLNMRSNITLGIAVPEMNVPERPFDILNEAFTLPTDYFTPKKPISFEEAIEMATSENSQSGTSCPSDTVLAAEVEKLRDEMNVLQTAMTAPARQIAPATYTSNILLEALLSRNRDAVNWLISNGARIDVPGILTFTDGSTIELNPKDYL